MEYKMGNVLLNAVTMIEAEKMILDVLNKGKKGVVSVMNTRTIRLSVIDPSYGEVVNASFLRLPDGMPLVWAARVAGFNNEECERVTGPDLFEEIVMHRSGYRHFLLGDTEETLKKLVIKIRTITNGKSYVVGIYSPPFQPIELEDYKMISQLINRSDPDFIWVALGSPKQDYFSAELLKHINRGVILNVGAAFRFALGEYRHPARVFQRLGLEGFFWRFRHSPLIEAKWYLVHSVFLIREISKIALKKEGKW